MPLVVVNRNPKKVSDETAKHLVTILPSLVAAALSIKNSKHARFTPNDVEVWVQDFGPLDRNTNDLQIMIWANHYPEREMALDFGRAKLVENLKSLGNLGDIKGSIWILLQPGSFEAF